MNFLLLFLETFEPFETIIARMPPELPCGHLGDYFSQDAELHGIFGKDKVDEVVEDDWNKLE